MTNVNSIRPLDETEISAISGAGEGEDFATAAVALATVAAGMTLTPLAPAAPAVLAVAATTFTLAIVAEAFESN